MENSALKSTFADKWFIYFFYATAFGLPWLRPQWHGVLIGLLTISWILSGGPKQIFSRDGLKPMLLLFISLFFLDLVGLTRTENKPYGIAHLETELPLLIFPLVILTSSRLLTPVVIRNCMIAFVAGVMTLNLVSLAFISWDLWDPLRLEANVIIAHNSIVRIHPVFLSVFISFSFFFVVGTYFPLANLTRNQLGWVLFSSSVLMVYLIWMNSRVGMVGFLASAVFYATYSRMTTARKVYAFFGIAILIFVLVSMPFSHDRFVTWPVQVMRSGKTDILDYNMRPLYFRSEIYKSSWEVIKGPVFLYGYGTGDFKDVLLRNYAENNLQTLLDKNLDAHSEYFAQLHRSGVIGLLLFLGLIIVPFYFAIKYHSPLYGAFLILFAVTAFFETILSSQKGVTFFSMISPMLYLGARTTGLKRPESPPAFHNIS